jgi:signal transduction histidine kinase
VLSVRLGAEWAAQDAFMLMGAAADSRGRRALLTGPLLTAAGWLVGGATTAAVVGSPYLVFGLHSRSAHLLLDTVDACVSLLLTYLLWGRFARSRRSQDLRLAQALLLLAAAGTVPVAAAALFDLGSAPPVAVWSAMAARVTAALLVVAAALVGRGDRVVRRGRGAVEVVPLLALLMVLTAVWLWRDALPAPVPQNPPVSATHPVISGHPLLLAGQLVAAAAFAVASAAFAAQAARRRDALLMWLGPACALAACARVNYFLFPSLYTDWVYTGDLLRTVSYAVLLMGAAREIHEYWSGWARATVLDDRRRLARELHDGVVQELGYIRSSAGAAVPDPAAHEDLVAACDRALDEARAAVDALGRSPDEPLGFVLHRAARQVAERYGARVLVDLDDSVLVDHSRRHALVRITREAVSNAIRHGHAESVRIRLERRPDGGCLVVEDDGTGFDPAVAARSTGYGLTSMRERALALPGEFDIGPADGGGTAVAVTWRDHR